MENDTLLVPNSQELVVFSTASGNEEDSDESDNIDTVAEETNKENDQIEENENEDNKGVISIRSK